MWMFVIVLFWCMLLFCVGICCFMWMFVIVLFWCMLLFCVGICFCGCLVRKDMDVIEHERLSNITLRHKIKLKNSTFIAVLHFSHSRVFNNEHNSYQYNESDTAPSLHSLAHSRVFNNEHNTFQYNESDTAPSLHRLAHSRVFNNEHNSHQYNESDTAPSLHRLAHSSLQQ